MDTGTITDAQRRAAKAAGFVYPISFLIVTLTFFGIHGSLVVAGDAAATARNIMSHEAQFRAGILGDLAYCGGIVALAVLFYVVLAPVNRTLALLAAAWKAIYAMAWVLITLDSYDALRLLGGAYYLRGFDVGQLQSWMKFHMSAGFDQYYVGLLFYGAGGVICGCLLYRAHYVPRVLAGSIVAGYLWCAACTAVFLVYPAFEALVGLSWFDVPMAICEMALSIWFVVKGLGRDDKFPSISGGPQL